MCLLHCHLASPATSQFLRFIILLSNVIPISLYVTLEVVKVFQCALLLNPDREMYHRWGGATAMGQSPGCTYNKVAQLGRCCSCSLAGPDTPDRSPPCMWQ